MFISIWQCVSRFYYFATDFLFLFFMSERMELKKILPTDSSVLLLLMKVLPSTQEEYNYVLCANQSGPRLIKFLTNEYLHLWLQINILYKNIFLN